MKKAFTLSEVLLALAIVGIVAAMVVPGAINNANKKMLTSQLKNSYQSIQDLAHEQIAQSVSKNLKDSEFAGNIINSNYFDISYNCSSTRKCWADSYKYMNKAGTFTISQSGARLNNGVAIKFIAEGDPSDAPYDTSIAKENNTEFYFGTFYIDVNGTDKPNILGRDLFAFRITDRGRLGDNSANEGGEDGAPKTKDQLLAACKNSSSVTACTTYLESNGWNMDY